MINEVEVILNAISKKTGLNIDQVKQNISSGNMGLRYESCKNCVMPKCDRCQMSFNQKLINKQ